MRTSEDGLKLIKTSEGCILHIYKDQAGYDTIGIGHLLTDEDKASGRFAAGITEEEAMDLLRIDVVKAEADVLRLVKVSLTQNQFDALVDFVFNLGGGALASSTLLKKLNKGDYDACYNEFLKWDKAYNPATKKKESLAGLTRRRKREADLFRS